MEAAKPYPKQVKPKPHGTTKPKPKLKDDFALVKYAGTGAIGISGKIAGTVFTTGGSQGAFMRVWAKPRNVRNALTQTVRGLFAGISTAWTSLTPGQILAWNGQASLYTRVNVFGDNRSLKGNTAFQRVNNIYTSIGVANVTDPPLVSPATFIITDGVFIADVSGSTFTFNIVEFAGLTALPANTFIKAYATTQRPASQSFFGKSAYRYFGFYGPTVATNPLDMFTDYTAKFGPLIAGSKISVALEVVLASATEFHKSGLFYIDTIVVA